MHKLFLFLVFCLMILISKVTAVDAIPEANPTHISKKLSLHGSCETQIKNLIDLRRQELSTVNDQISSLSISNTKKQRLERQKLRLEKLIENSDKKFSIFEKMLMCQTPHEFDGKLNELRAIQGYTPFDDFFVQMADYIRIKRAINQLYGQ